GEYKELPGRSFPGYSGGAFSPRDPRVALVRKDTVYILRGGEHLPLHGSTADIHRVDFSPDAKLIAAASVDKSVRVWNTDSRDPVVSFKGVAGFAFSRPDGKEIALLGEDQTVKLYEFTTGNSRPYSLDGRPVPAPRDPDDASSGARLQDYL